MKSANESPQQTRVLQKGTFQQLFAVLADRGYTVIGPKIEQEAIVCDRINSAKELPRGWTDEQSPGVYRLKRRIDDRWFGFVVGPHSWKQFLFPPQEKLAEARKTEAGWEFESSETTPPSRVAFLGVRACELAAMRVQDRVFLGGPFIDATYKRRRESALVIAVNCTQAASTCFCTSLGTGPRCKTGFDLALTELDDCFVVEVATAAGGELVAALDTREVTSKELADAEAARRPAAEQIERRLDTTGIRDLLLSNLEHRRWDEVAQRCLSCANCTLVCPTCFCSSVKEVSDLAGTHVERHREWDSCFNFEFSYMNGGVVRNEVRSRYRQWLTHKLASWHDQFGTSGCVGCGRCITWCPVGIDLTEEVAAIRGSS